MTVAAMMMEMKKTNNIDSNKIIVKMYEQK